LKRFVSLSLAIILVVGVLSSMYVVQPVKAEEIIYIRADGSIEPSTVPIQRDGDLYTLTGNITDYCGIVVERDNIILDGANRLIDGGDRPSSYGVTLEGRENVTIRSLIMEHFEMSSTCIYLNSSSNNFILANDLTSDFRYGSGLILDYSSNNVISGNNMTGGVCLWLRSSSNNLVSGNNMVGSYYYGVDLVDSDFNTFSANNIQHNNNNGLSLDSSSSNSIIGNNITNNGYGISLTGSNNSVYHNNFVDNSQQADSDSTNLWDDGYPSGGNYWSDYNGSDTYSGPYQNETGGDEIGDVPYAIDGDNADHYPLVNLYEAPASPRTWIVDDDGPADFHTIQEAINAASDGDTVFVRNGTYSGIVIDKSLTIEGEDKYTTIIQGGSEPYGAGMRVLANNVRISKFTIQNARGPPIRVHGDEGPSYGNITISDNIMTGCGEPVRLINTSRDMISCNVIRDSSGGIGFDWANGNIVHNNTLINVGIGIVGGYPSYNNTFSENTIIGNSNAVSMNGIFDNNRFFHNSFINNTIQVAISPTMVNIWDNSFPSGGNYWSDYTGVDTNGDGIGDAPYIIDGNNQDRYPLVHSYGSIVNSNTSLTYLTIQSAINAPETLNGHTTLVETGTYQEQLTVNKTLSIIGSGSESTTISGSPSDCAVEIAADNVELSGFTICGGGFGLKVYSHNNNVHDNSIVENGFIGIYLYLSSGNTFTSNNVSRNGYGVRLVHSGGNAFKHDSIFDNEWQELVIEGNTVSNFVEDMDTSNSVDGKPVYYWVNQQDKIVPSDAGYVALVDCRRILVQNLTFNRNGQGVLLAGTTDSMIANNALSTEYYGIYMVDSSNVTIRNCTIANCNFAMEIWFSNGNKIIGNNIVSNAYGVELAWSNYNNVSGNTIEQTSEYNGWGVCLSVSATGNQIYENDFAHNSQGMNIQLFYPGENKMYHNNFIQNAIQVYNYEPAINVWDDGYPSGGNYWSDYNGSDLYLGEFQTEPGSDGMGDMPYVIDADNRDNYPLMNPWPSGWKLDFTAPTNHPIVDFAVYNGSLYAAADDKLYVKDENSCNVVDALTFVTSLEPYGGKLVVGGQGGLYCYDGTPFNLIFSVPTYVKVLGAYNDTLYAGTMLDNPPKLYYCNGSADNPSDWYVDTDFSAILGFSGAFGSIDSFAVYGDVMYLGSGGKLYSFNGASWSIAASYDDVYAFLDMQIYNGRLYLATRDQGWRKPMYLGGSGFSGRVIEFDGASWNTVLDHDYWIYSLGVYDDKLYAGTANKILTYNGTSWETSFSATEGAYNAISMINYDGKIYAGMGNGYIFADPAQRS